MTTEFVKATASNVIIKVEDKKMSLPKAVIIIRACNTVLRAISLEIMSNRRNKMKRSDIKVRVKSSKK